METRVRPLLPHHPSCQPPLKRLAPHTAVHPLREKPPENCPLPQGLECPDAERFLRAQEPA